MSDLPTPEQRTPGIEKPVVPKPAEPTKEAQPLGAAEQQIVARIDKDGDEDKVLKDIAGVQPQAGGEAPKTPFQQFLDEESSNDRTPVVGGEIVSPTAVRVDDPRNPDGSVNFKASQERGWLSAITSANAKRELPEAERGKNVQDIVDAAIAAGVPREQIGNHLQSLGVNTVRREEAQQVQQEQPQAAQATTTEVRADEPTIGKSLDYVNRLAESVLAGRSQPSALQNYVDYSVRNGVPRERIEAVLRARGIPITEKSAAPAEAKPQFDAQKPIDGKTYNGLSKRFNDVRSRLLKEGNREKLDRLNGVPIGRILNGPFSGGDTVEARLAYNQISGLLDEVEGIGQPQVEQTNVVQPTPAEVKASQSSAAAPAESRPEAQTNTPVASSPEQAVMDETIAFKVLGNDPTASNADRIAAATQHPSVAARLGWTPADIEELKQELAASQMTEENTSAVPENEKEVTREQLQQETFGRLYGNLLTSFAETPGITKEELMRKVGEYAREHRLAGPNLGRAVGIVNRFCQTRDLVRSVREQYPDDRALFEHTFGFSPQGDVQVIMGNIDIAFYIPNIDDRARAHTGNAQREDRTARTAAGAVLNRVHEPSLSGLVIALEYKDTPDVLDHERQHVVNNRLLKMKELRGTNNENLDTMSTRINNGETPETAISSYLDSLRATRLCHASDEVIAFFAGGTRPEQIKQGLTYERASYGERFRGLTPTLENMIVGKVGEQYRQYVLEQGNRELGEGYDQSISDCVDAFQTLRTNGYSQEQTVGFLATIPPKDWKTFVTNMTAKAT